MGCKEEVKEEIGRRRGWSKSAKETQIELRY